MPTPEAADRDSLIAQVRTLARDIGTVASVAERPSEKTAEQRQMIARLNSWRSDLLDIADDLEALDGPRPEQHKPECASISHRRSDDGGVTYKWPAVACDCDGPRRQEPEPK